MVEHRWSSEEGFSLVEAIVSVALLSIGVWLSTIAFDAYARVTLPSPYRDLALDEAQNIVARAQALNAYHAQGSYHFTSSAGVPADSPFLSNATYTVQVPTMVGGQAQTVSLRVVTAFAAGADGAGVFTVDVTYPHMPTSPTGMASDVHLVEYLTTQAYAPGTTIHIQLPGEPAKQ